VYEFFRKRLLQKRLIALAAAYAIALSGLITSFGGAQMTAAAGAQPDFVICHSDGGGDPAPDGGQTGGKTCLSDCCTGCLIFSVALPQPPTTAIALMASAGERIAQHTIATFIAGPETRFHQSRAPPQNG
jgi:hypothetical protein